MPRDEREAAASAPWLSAAQPDPAGPAIERLPGLVFALEQFALNIPEAAASFCKLEGAPTLEATRATSLFEAIGRARPSSRRCCISESIDAQLLAIFDPTIVDMLAVAIFGDGNASLAEQPARPHTTIELHLVAELAKRVAVALDAAFVAVAPLDVRFERVTTLLDLHALGRRDGPAIEVDLTLETSAGQSATRPVNSRRAARAASQEARRRSQRGKGGRATRAGRVSLRRASRGPAST